MSQKIYDIIEQQLKDAFHLFDKAGTSIISTKDFGTLMRSLGHNISQQTARNITDSIVNEDIQQITYPQFQKYMSKLINSAQLVDSFKKAFEVFDIDKDGLISVQDLNNILVVMRQNRTEDEVKQMISDGDIDGDGYINFDQFVRILATR